MPTSHGDAQKGIIITTIRNNHSPRIELAMVEMEQIV